MNRDRRKVIEKLAAQIEEIKTALLDLAAEERDYYENMPENLQQGERGQVAEEACDNLESAAGSLEEAIDYLDMGTVRCPTRHSGARSPASDDAS